MLIISTILYILTRTVMWASLIFWAVSIVAPQYIYVSEQVDEAYSKMLVAHFLLCGVLSFFCFGVSAFFGNFAHAYVFQIPYAVVAAALLLAYKYMPSYQVK